MSPAAVRALWARVRYVVDRLVLTRHYPQDDVDGRALVCTTHPAPVAWPCPPASRAIDRSVMLF